MPDTQPPQMIPLATFRPNGPCQTRAEGEANLLAAPQAAPELRSISSTDELLRRPSRPPDYATENRSLVALAKQLAVSPEGILQELADTALNLCRAHSAGLSLLEEGDQGKNFHWRAIAGQWASHRGGGTPRDFGPCGTVLDRNAPQLLSHPELDFPYFGEVTPSVEDGLLVPFYVAGKAVGTIWIVAHEWTRRFDAEDLRVMTSLATFAGAAYQSVLTLNATIHAKQELQWFASIIESSDEAIISKDLDGVITSWNNGAQRIFGYTAAEVIGKPINILIPPDRDDEEPVILAQVRRGERIDHYETVRMRKDGSRVDISLTVSPVKTPEGRIIGASKIARDISERKRSQEQQSLLVREMSHRVKNLFAVTSGLVSLSARSASTPDDLAAAVQERLAALTRAHELTRPGLISIGKAVGDDTTLHAVIRAIFAPYVNRHSEGHEAIVLTGPDLPISGNAITSVALVLNELATNAAKYGALSSLEGVVHVDCSLQNGELLLTWKERGGPSINGPPDEEGFGSTLARRIVSGQFGGRLSNHWEPDGLVVHLAAPVKRITR
jgi:PAS domain S-box-containing protein